MMNISKLRIISTISLLVVLLFQSVIGNEINCQAGQQCECQEGSDCCFSCPNGQVFDIQDGVFSHKGGQRVTSTWALFKSRGEEHRENPKDNWGTGAYEHHRVWIGERDNEVSLTTKLQHEFDGKSGKKCFNVNNDFIGLDIAVNAQKFVEVTYNCITPENPVKTTTGTVTHHGKIDYVCKPGSSKPFIKSALLGDSSHRYMDEHTLAVQRQMTNQPTFIDSNGNHVWTIDIRCSGRTCGWLGSREHGATNFESTYECIACDVTKDNFNFLTGECIVCDHAHGMVDRETDSCSCQTGYRNPPLCADFDCSQQKHCSPHHSDKNECIGPNVCQCDEVVWSGEDCGDNIRDECPVNELTQQTCNNHGTCQRDATCACWNGWFGAACEKCIVDPYNTLQFGYYPGDPVTSEQRANFIYAGNNVIHGQYANPCSAGNICHLDGKCKPPTPRSPPNLNEDNEPKFPEVDDFTLGLPAGIGGEPGSDVIRERRNIVAPPIGLKGSHNRERRNIVAPPIL